jgi:hypothetical protein
MRMIVKRHPRVSPGDEKGMVLVLGLLLVAVLSLVGTTAVMTSTTDMKINSNYKSGAQAFYIAEAGIERARAQLMTLGGTTLSQALAASRGANNQLSDSTDVANFFANGAFVTDDVPYMADTSFAGGTYRVYLTNDPTEGVTSSNDTNLKVTLTSFGQGPNNSLAVVQAVVKKLTLPPLPGAIVLPGSVVSFQGGLNADSQFAGNAAAAIALTSDAARTSVIANLTAIGRLNTYTSNAGDGASSIRNTAATIDPTWNSVNGIEELYRMLMSVADTITGTTTGASATTTMLTNAEVGTVSDRRIVVVNGNAILDNIWNDGAGILVVTGQLTLRRNSDYKGLILCIGQGKVVAEGWDNGSIKGALLVAKTRDASNNLLATLGNPTYNLSDDHDTVVQYIASEITAGLPAAQQRFIKKSWKKFF